MQCIEQTLTKIITRLLTDYIPVRTPCLRTIIERLCTLSNELKWWTDWCKPYMPFSCCGRPVSNADLMKHHHHSWHKHSAAIF